MSDLGIVALLAVGAVIAAVAGLYLIIHVAHWLTMRGEAAAGRLADQQHARVAGRIEAQLGQSEDTLLSAGTTRLGRRTGLDTAAAETCRWSALDRLGIGTQQTTVIPAIPDLHPENARDADPAPDLTCVTGLKQSAPSRLGAGRRAGVLGAPVRGIPAARGTERHEDEGGQRPFEWSASA